VGAGQLAGWLQADLPQALAALERMRNALEAYVTGPIPTGTPPATEAAADAAAETPDAEGAKPAAGDSAP